MPITSVTFTKDVPKTGRIFAHSSNGSMSESDMQNFRSIHCVLCSIFWTKIEHFEEAECTGLQGNSETPYARITVPKKVRYGALTAFSKSANCYSLFEGRRR